MDADVKRDRLGNVLAIGDAVATAMIARNAGYGLALYTVAELRPGSAVLRSLDSGRDIWRAYQYVVKVVTT